MLHYNITIVTNYILSMPNLDLITVLKFKIQEVSNKEIGEGKCHTSQAT